MTSPLEELDDYVSGAMDDEAAQAFEEGLFRATLDAPAAQPAVFLERLSRSAADLVARGSFEITYTEAEAKALMRSSPLASLYIDVGQGVPGSDTLAQLNGKDLLFISFPVELGESTRVDLELGDDQDLRRLVFPDVKVDRQESRVLLCCEGDLARAAFRGPLVSTIIGVRGLERRVLAQYRYAGPGP